MKLATLITTLVLGSSSVAMASPDAVTTYPYPAPVTYPAPATQYPAPAPAYRPEYRPDYRPDYRPQPSWGRPSRWVTLGTVNHIVDGEMAFHVNSHQSEFRTLRLQNLGGKSLIYRVEIEFENGRTRTVEVNQYLTASNPSITVNVPGRRSFDVAKVTVIGRNARQSAYRVLAI